MDTIAPFRRGFRAAALVCSLASAVLTLVFGLHQSEQWLIALACAGFLVACSLASDYIWLFVRDAFGRRDWATTAVFTTGALLVLSLNLISNLGSVGWQRDVQITQSSLQRMSYEDTRQTERELVAKRIALEGRLKSLEGTAGWQGARPAASYDGLIAAKKLEIEQEKRRGGCGPRCLARTQELAELEANKATAEAHERDAKSLAATLAALERVRQQSADKTVQVAAPASQADFFASLITVSLKPGDEARTWTDRGLAGWIAIGLVAAPILFGLIGWTPAGSTTSGRPAVLSTAAHGVTTPRDGAIAIPTPRVVQITDTELARRLAALKEVAA